MPEQFSHEGKPGSDSEIHSTHIAKNETDDLEFNEEPPEEEHEEQHRDVAERAAILLGIIEAYDEDPETVRKIDQFRQDPQPLGVIRDEAKFYNKLIKEFPLIEDKEDVASFFQLIEAGVSLWGSGVRPERASSEERAIFINAVVAHRVILFSNLRLVGSIAARRVAGGMTFMDLVDEGIVGLDKSIAGFDYTTGFKFSTYATKLITGKIQRAVANFSRAIRLPANAHDAWMGMKGEMSKLIQELGREPTESELVQELAQRTGRTIEAASEYLKATGYHLPSLNAPLSTDESDSSTAEDMLEEVDNENLADLAITRVAIEKVLHSDALSDRDKLVLALSFGVFENLPKLEVKNKADQPIDYKQHLKLAAERGGLYIREIATVLGISDEKVNQLRAAAIYKARSVLNLNPVEPLLEPIETQLPQSIRAEVERKYPPDLQSRIMSSLERHLKLTVLRIVPAQSGHTTAAESDIVIDFTTEVAESLGHQGKLAIAHWLGIGPLLTSINVPSGESAVARALGVSPDRLRSFINERYYQPLLKKLDQSDSAT